MHQAPCAGSRVNSAVRTTPPRRPGRRRGLRRREGPSRVLLRHRHAYRGDPPGLTEGGGCFCSAASREAPQSTRSNAGQARPPASDQQPAAHQGLRRGLLVKGCLRNSPATGLPLRPLSTGAPRGKSHGRRAPPPRPRQRLAAAPPHARPGPRAGALSARCRREYRKKRFKVRRLGRGRPAPELGLRQT